MKLPQTERLSIEEGKLEDATFIFNLLNSPTWIEFIGDRGINSIADAENYIKNSLLAHYKTYGFGLYVLRLKSTQEPIGLCGFLQRNTLKSPDIGYALLPAFEGQGYAFEAANAVMDHGKRHLNLHPILAITSNENIRSKRLLRKIGLSKKDTITLEGSTTEVTLYSN